MPDLDALVREKGQVEIPEYLQSVQAEKWLTEMTEEESETYQFIAVFNSGTDEALNKTQKQDIENAIELLRDQSEELGITHILAHVDHADAEKQLVSEDGTTILTQIYIDTRQGTVDEVLQTIKQKIELDSVDTYLTGKDIVLEDFAKSSQDGIKKTEVIAVIFILVVLVIVFRSPIIPIISLITVGVSYIVSLGIVAQLVDQFDFPFSNFTQVFLIVLLFGVGTDYNILLYTRFKEELGRQRHVLKAIIETYRTAGKTVFYSAIAVFIGFMALYLAEFKLYQATSAVAIGVAILLLVLLTLNPFFMGVFGIKMFWPIKTIKGQNENKLWLFLSKQSYVRPILSLVIILLISTPFILKYTGDLNYNDLVEISDDYESKQGIAIIEEHFPAGYSSPATLVIKADESLATQKGLQDLDRLAEVISRVDGVSEVFSVTRPTGEKIEEFYIQTQTDMLNQGLGSAQDGLGIIHEGLSSAKDQLEQVDRAKFKSVQQLIDGTSVMKEGVGQLHEALEQVAAGFTDGSKGASELATGLNQLKQSVSSLNKGAMSLNSAYQELEQGFREFKELFTTLEMSVSQAIQSYSAIEQSMYRLIHAHPELSNDQHVQTVILIAKNAKEQFTQLQASLQTLSPQYDTAVNGLQEANNAFSKIHTGLQQVEAGIEQVQVGANTLASGLGTGESGVKQIMTKTKELETGLATMHEGQKQLQAGLTELEDKMVDLQEGLGQTTEGLSDISDGLLEVQEYLGEVSDSETNQVFYIPEDVIHGEAFKDSLDMYMSDDRTITSMTIILDVNPYTKEAMSIMEAIDTQVQAAAKDFSATKVELALGGKSMSNVDLQEISKQDFLRTITIMLIGIAIVLIIITRSFWQSMIIIASLILAFFTSLGLTELLSQALLDQSTLSWNVPFFSFIMMITLGVDYSIFLMMRFNEMREEGNIAIIDAAKHIGGVVLSAAFILGGTFAALIPSGIVTLMQVAILVLIGLVLLSFVTLPMLLPAILSLSDKTRQMLTRQKKVTSHS